MSAHVSGKIECLICHKAFLKVGSHIWQAHHMTAREYREHFNLEVKRGLLSESERVKLRENVFANGTVNNLKAGAKHRFVSGDKRAGNYKRSPVTLARLSKLSTFKKV